MHESEICCVAQYFFYDTQGLSYVNLEVLQYP